MRKICVFTGTRAEYGLLRPLMNLLKNDSLVDFQLIVSGMHLSPEFGLTVEDIERDDFKIDEKVEMLLSSSTGGGIVKSMGVGMIGFSDSLSRLKSDLLVILGDRFEALAVATSAMILGIPIVHLHGGEATFGLIDEAIRHSISKMSHLHFTATEEYRNRVIQLGEQPKNVFNVGGLGMDNIKNMELLSKTEFEKSICLKLNKRNILLTFHPVTLENYTAKNQFQNILNALDKFEDTNIIITKPNSDTDGRIIIKMIDEYVAQRENAIAFTSLGQLRYLSALKYVDVVVGNSSSGLAEVPSFKIPTVNIGDRQAGRMKAESIIDCDNTEEAILSAVNKGLSQNFQKQCKRSINPYGEGGASNKIFDVIKDVDLTNILKKQFYNIPF